MSTRQPLPWFPEDLPKGLITLEEGAAHTPTLCECCGRRTIIVNGFLSRSEWACAAYFAVWTEGHLDTQGMDLTFSVGGWGETMSHHPRYVISIRCLVSGGHPQFMVLDPAEHRIANRWTLEQQAFLGSFVRREEALQHSEMPEVFLLAERVIYDDHRVNAALRG